MLGRCRHDFAYTQGHFFCRKCGRVVHKDHMNGGRRGPDRRRDYVRENDWGGSGGDYVRREEPRAEPEPEVETVYPMGSVVPLLVGIGIIVGAIVVISATWDPADAPAVRQAVPAGQAPEAPASGPRTYYYSATTSTSLGAANGQGVIESAAADWEGINPGLRFETAPPGSSGVDFAIRFEEVRNKDHAGLWCPGGCGDARLRHAEIVVDTGALDCRGAWNAYAEGTMADILKHEIGHHLGLGHHASPSHLMHGYDAGPGAYDSLGYAIPDGSEYDRIAAALPVEAELDEIEADLDRLYRRIGGANRELDRMGAGYNPYPSYGAEHEQSVRTYNTLSRKTDEVNRMVDEYNALADRHGELAAKFECFYYEGMSQGRTAYAQARQDPAYMMPGQASGGAR